MPRVRNDATGRFTTAFEDGDFLAALRRLDGAASTVEIADAVGCHRDTARRRLADLADGGPVRRHDVGDAALWVLLDDGGG